MRLMLRLCGLALCALALSAGVWADPIYQGRSFRVTGTHDAERINASRVQLREPENAADRGQVEAHVSTVDGTARRLTLGPFAVEWTNDTRFVDLSPSELVPGLTLRVWGTVRDEVVVATRVQRAGGSPPKYVQITATITDERRDVANDFDVRMLGQKVRITQTGYNRTESLTQRQDTRRTDRPLTTELLGRPLTLTGEYDLSYRDRRNLRLDRRSHVRNLDHELKLELFYPVTPSIAIFVAGKGAYEDELQRAGGNESTTKYFSRDQTWIYFDRPGRGDFSMQAGRQNINEVREWWWDDDLDALRLYYDRGPDHAELSLAREWLRERSDESDIDPVNRDVVRVLGRWSRLWAPKQSVEIYGLYHDDRSDTEALGSKIANAREDESDARLLWAGVRAIGDRSLGTRGDLRYWFDAATIWGKERVLGFDTSTDPGTVNNRRDVRVRGLAMDVGVSWRSTLPARPAVTAGYAWSSGDGNGSDGVDGAFRQTGLHNNKWRFFGVNRFRYYGELFRPELSNLGISTLGLGVTFWTNSSVELVHHRYQQSTAATSLRDMRITARPDGIHSHLGDEVDLIVGMREWRYLDLSVLASIFRAGRAFGHQEGQRAYQVGVAVAINF